MAGKSSGPGLALAALVAAAAGLAYAATRAAGPVPPVNRAGIFTEIEAPAQNFVSHLVKASELLTVPVRVPHRYPVQTCPGITATMHNGWAPQYVVDDPQLAALPSEKAW